MQIYTEQSLLQSKNKQYYDQLPACLKLKSHLWNRNLSGQKARSQCFEVDYFMNTCMSFGEKQQNPETLTGKYRDVHLGYK